VSWRLFANPQWLLPAAVVLAVLGAALGARGWLGARRLRRLLGPGRGGAAVAASVASDAALFAALALVAVALLGPRIWERSTLLGRSGVDVAILVDVSRSMDARDAPPSRLQRARRAAGRVLERLAPDSRAALAAFAGRGVLLTPLTPDKVALAELLPALDTELLQPGGSDLDAGLAAAVDAFEDGSRRPRVVLVLSDGEVRGRSQEPAEASAGRADARVAAVAFGSPFGATIPDHGVPLRDERGEIVVTRRQSQPLARLAEARGGRLFVGDEWGDFDLEAAMGEIEREARLAPGERVERRTAVPAVLPFAALALAVLLAEAAPWRAGLRWLGPGGARRRLAAGAVLASCLVASGLTGADPGATEADRARARDDTATLEARARERPLTGPELVALGLARSRSGDDAEAEHAFREAAVSARDPRVAAVAYHDLGVTALARGDLEAARDLFFDALAVNPDDTPARFNLEWTLAALRRPEAPPESPSPEPADEDEPERSEPERRRSAEPPPAPAAGGQQQAPAEARPAPLSAGDRERWLERVRDDPGRALRTAAAAADAAPRPRAPEVAW
jgi:tetratricopeptide (TPR) repeat protein